MKKIVLGTLAAIAVAAPLTLAGPAHAATALTNASFEEAAVTLSDVYYVVDANHQDLTGWTAGGAGIDIVDEAYWNADEGSRSIDLNAYGPGSISQKFETEPGQTYDVKFAMSGNPAAQVERGPKTMNVTAANTSAEFIYDTAVAQNTLIDMKYKPQTFSFAATGSSTTLTFASTTETIGDTPDGRKAAFGPVVDDVEVTAAPNVAKTLVWHTWSGGPVSSVPDKSAAGWHPTSGDPQSKVHKSENHEVGVPYYVPNNGNKGGGSWFLWLETTA
jgi:choice-of-anchor C domain-containing protein